MIIDDKKTAAILFNLFNQRTPNPRYNVGDVVVFILPNMRGSAIGQIIDCKLHYSVWEYDIVAVCGEIYYHILESDIRFEYNITPGLIKEKMEE